MELDDQTRLEIFKTQELADLFDEMSDEVKKKILAQGFRKAGKIILDETKSNLNGATKAAVKFTKQLGMKVPPGEIALMVGMKKKGSGCLAHLLEDGTVSRFYMAQKNNKLFRAQKKGTTQGTGRMTAQNFWDKALNTTEPAVIDSIYGFVEQAFNRLIDKYEKKNNK